MGVNLKEAKKSLSASLEGDKMGKNGQNVAKAAGEARAAAAAAAEAERMNKMCSNCGKVGSGDKNLSKCATSELTRYCSRDCQKSH